MSAKRKPKRLPTIVRAKDDLRTLVVVASGVLTQGMPIKEGGPAAWTDQPWEGDNPLCNYRVLGAVLTQAATKPSVRAILSSSRPFHVFVFADTVLSEADKDAACRYYMTHVGSYTESRRLVDRVRWIPMARYHTPSDISAVAAEELRIAMSENSSIELRDCMFVVWLSPGIHDENQLQFGRAICDRVFSFVTNDDFSLSDLDDESDSADWWKIKK